MVFMVVCFILFIALIAFALEFGFVFFFFINVLLSTIFVCLFHFGFIFPNVKLVFILTVQND